MANSMFYYCSDVMLILGCKESTAYRIIRQLSDELKKMGYQKPPAGRIQKNFFCEKHNLDRKECDEFLEQCKKEQQCHAV